MKLIFSRNKSKQIESNRVLATVYNLLDSARSLFNESETVKKVAVAEKAMVEQSSSAAHEIESMVSTTAAAALQLDRTANLSNQSVSEASSALSKLSETIVVVSESSKRLQESVSNGLKEIGTVTTTMQEIRTKAKIINDIVFQTKLLSFNAAVESARAGEHGKGFAVVAEEMSNLAKASGLAAKEIEAILEESVEKTKNHITKVSSELESVARETVSAIDQVSAKTTEITSIFSRLSEYAHATQSQAKEISKATEEQNIGVGQISQSLTDLATSTQKLETVSVSSNKNSADLADRVERLATDLNSLIESFGLKVVTIEKKFDFDAAISAHIDWRMKLTKYMSNPDGSLESEKVCKDNLCKLGLWIYGDGAHFKKHNPSFFEQLRSSHAEFHQIAGKVISLVNSGNTQGAAKLMAPEGPYLEVSERTVNMIRDLKAQAGNESIAA